MQVATASIETFRSNLNETLNRYVTLISDIQCRLLLRSLDMLKCRRAEDNNAQDNLSAEPGVLVDGINSIQYGTMYSIVIDFA